MVYKFTRVYIEGCLGVLYVWDELLARLSLKSNPWNHEGFFFFLQNSRFVGIHPPTFFDPISTYPQLERKKFDYPYMDLHLEARLLSFSKQVNGNFCAVRRRFYVLKKKNYFCFLSEVLQSELCFAMDFVIGFNEVGCLDHGRVTKFVFLSASNEALGTRPSRSLKKLRVFAFNQVWFNQNSFI